MALVNAIWLKPLGRYGDPNLPNYTGDDPVVAYRRRSSRHLDGTPEKCLLTSVSQQREYCKAEGLIPPDDVGMAEVGANGKDLSTSGFAGQWT